MPWQMVGADKPKAILSAMISSGRLPHALLFLGSKGCGKNHLARELAKAVLCLNPAPDKSPCQKCASCLKVAKDLHPDVATLSPASGRANLIAVEGVKELREAMAFRPYEGAVKVFIIRKVDRFSPDSGNMILKTLEEPPPDSLLILTAASESNVMTTILSRCLRLKIPPLSNQLILNALAEEKSLAGPAASLICALSGGALGLALSLDAEYHFNLWQEINDFMGQDEAMRREAAINWGRKMAQEPEERQPEILALLNFWWREVMLFSTGQEILTHLELSYAQKYWASIIDGPAINRINQAHLQLADSLARFIKAELVFDNYWLNVLSIADAC